MRFPSLSLALSQARSAALRFPWVLLAGIVSAVVCIIMFDDGDPPPLLMRLLFSSGLGISLFFALAVSSERATSRKVGALASLVGLAVLTALFFAFPGWRDPVAARRLVQLAVGFHLLVAVLPYLGRGEANGFWQYNRTLFLRFLVSALYSAVLYLGLIIALLAIDKLLGIHVDEKAYFRLWVTVVFVFNTWFFLGGVPRDLPLLETRRDYPTAIKVFSQFILVPIVTLYLVILTLYMGKIVITQSWPSGWIGYLVSSVAVVGILSLLLVYPVRDRVENRWIATYSRGFYIALFPSIIMLLLAIWKRVQQYGITENRYYLIVLALWLTGIALYSIATRSRSIKVIPATLCALALVTGFGPWGAFSVSERSQKNRLEALLTANNMLTDGRAHAAATPPSVDDRREIGNIVDYLIETHGSDPLRDWFEDGLADVDTLTGKPHAVAETGRDRVLARLDLEYIPPWASRNATHFNFNVHEDGHVLDIRGFDHAVRIQSAWPQHFKVDSDAYTLDYRMWDHALFLLEGASGDTVLTFPLEPLLERLEARREEHLGNNRVPGELMVLEATGPGIRARFHLRSFNGTLGDQGPDLQYAQGDLLLRRDR